MQPRTTPDGTRRRLLAQGGALGLALAVPASHATQAPTVLPAITEGPFYPPRRWRASGSQTDWDADLTRVQQGAQTLIAEGEHLELQLEVQDSQGRRIDRCELEIWQCDARGVYRHPRVDSAAADPGFQGFGAATSRSDGIVRLRTIRPAVYPGRTPHIHLKLRHPSFGEWTSQLFVAGEPANARDFLWRSLQPAEQQAVAMRLQAAAPGAAGRWQASHALVVPVR